MKEKDNPFGFEKAEESSGFLLWQVSNLWQRGIKKALEPFDLTHSQFVLLASTHWLVLHGQEVTQILLSSHAKIDPMTTSTVVRTLEQKGFIHRKEHTTDTRAKTVELTKSGTDLVHLAVVAVESFDELFFSKLGGNLNTFNQQLLDLMR